ncbi:MAG: DNA polymerase III subunit beta [Candidatus Vogelbacteria bacterium]|nr:DNA polymerase III subunit beta [Candidatus Vogelbacteria bacterium]
MKLELIKNKLKEVVSIAERVTGKNLSLPILSAILLEAKNNSLTIKATNLDVGLEIELPAKITEEGSVAVNAGILNGFLGNINKEDKVKLELIKENIHISTGRSSTLIKSFSAEDFPVIPRVENKDSISFNTKDILAGLRAVLYSASLSDIKPEISSVYVYQEGKELVFVATDSFRLAEKKIVIRDNSREFQPVIIPYKNVAEIIKVFDGVDEEVRINTDKNQISLYTDNIHFTSRVIDGNFPDYKQIMPKKFKTEATLSRDELLNALKLSNIFSDKFNQINLKISPKNKIFSINSQNQDVGENNVNLEAVLEGEDLEMSFNAKYILDSFQSIVSDTVVLKFDRPLLMEGVGDRSFQYIVMPVNR